MDYHVCLDDYRINKDGHPMTHLRKTSAGFTLIEMMVAVAIIGILSTIALPAYQNYTRQGRRADGQAALLAVATAQERWRINHTTYTSTIGDLSVPAVSESGLYDISIQSGATGTGYTAQAVAKSGTSQANDTGCTTLTLAINNTTGTTTRGPAGCWKK